jgi:hypothetical protein
MQEAAKLAAIFKGNNCEKVMGDGDSQINQNKQK